MSSAESFVVPNWRKYRKETDDFNCQKYPKSAKMTKMTKIAKFVAISRRPKIYDVHMGQKIGVIINCLIDCLRFYECAT